MLNLSEETEHIIYFMLFQIVGFVGHLEEYK
jgi:hypothetical protein